MVRVEQVVPVAAPEHAVSKAVVHNRLENSNLQKMANENPSLSASTLISVYLTSLFTNSGCARTRFS